MEFKYIVSEIKDRIGYIYLNRLDKKNALNFEFVSELKIQLKIQGGDDASINQQIAEIEKKQSEAESIAYAVFNAVNRIRKDDFFFVANIQPTIPCNK
jgi:hypothetical protein